MAKKQFDDLNWDQSLDYDFDDPFAPVSQQKKRGVIQRVATSFASGAKDALTTPANLKKMAGDMLPKGYGEAIRFSDDIFRQGEELHNIAMKELAPSIPQMRRITQRHLPRVKQYLPKSVSDRLEEFTEDRTYRAKSDETLNEEAIQKGMAEVFGVQMEADARQNAENRVERAMQHTQAMHMSRNQLRSLDLMQQGMMRLVNYQDDITNKFQRRSLELQTRHYFVARDSLKLQAETARRVQAHLEALVTNTAMPDIQKQDLAHTAKQTFRNRILGSMQNSAGNFASSYFQNVFKRMQNSVRAGAGEINDGLGMMDLDGDGPPMLEMLARMGGQYALTGGASFLGKRSAKFLASRSPQMAQMGGLLQRGVTGMPYFLNRYAQSATKRTGLGGILEDGLKTILGKYKLDPTIGRAGIGNMDKPATFDRLTRMSIVEVIPGLLSRIEHNTARVLDPKAERQMWNIDRRAFTNMRTASSDMVKQIADPGRLAATKRTINEFIDEMIGDKPLTNETRRELFRQLMVDSGNGIPFDPDRYMAPGSDTTELSARSKMELGNILRSVGMLSNGKRDQIWMAERDSKFHQIDFGGVAPISAAGVYRSAGYRELLDDQGLVDRDGQLDKLRLSKIMDLIEQSNYDDIKVKQSGLKDRFEDFLGQNVTKRADAVLDLYIEGGSQAVLTAAKLKAGAYRDAVTGEIITKWGQIKGPIRDMTSNDIVLDLGQLTRGLVDRNGKTYTFNIRSAVTGASNWAQEQISSAREQINARTNPIKDVLNAKGEVLLAGWKLKAGKYRDALTRKPIQSVSDIAGPVIDENGQTVVTAADVAAVLTEDGRPLVDALHRMRQRNESMVDQASAAPPLFQSATQSPQAANSNFLNPEAGSLGDSNELVRLNTEQLEVLKSIAQILAAQGPNGGPGQDPTYRRGFLDSIAVGGLKGAWGATKLAGRGTWWWTKLVGKTAGGTIGAGASAVGAVASGTSLRVGNMIRAVKDIYVEGKRQPVMIAQRIRMGHYRDVNSKKKVMRWTDVTGPVVDITTGETILDQDDFDRGIFIKGPSGLTRLATKSVLGFGRSVVSFTGLAASLPFRVAGMALKAAGNTLSWATNKQVDVYVRGESSPRLTAEKMKQGRYYNAGKKKTGKIVRTYEDIYGEIKELQRGSDVAKADDKTVLHEDEVKDPGICGRWGTSLRTPLSRVLGAVGGALVGTVKGAAALYGGMARGIGSLFGGMFGMAGGAIGTLVGGPFKFLGALLNPFEKHGAKQVEWLEKIFGVLDKRLPGDKPRSGSWQEQFAKRDAEAKEEKDEKEKKEHDRKWGVGSLLSYFKDKGKGLFGLGGTDEDEDDEDEDDGDTTVVVGGGDGGGDEGGKKKGKKKGRKGGWRRNRRAAQLRKARAARGAAAAAGSTATAAGAVRSGGALARFRPRSPTVGGVAAGLAMGMGGDAVVDAVGGEKSMGGKAINGAITAAGVYGMGTMATSAAGMGSLGGVVAGGLGTAGTAVAGAAGAVLGAPIWIPLAAAAAVGAAAYYGYRQYKYGKMTPMRRFRYLQYGVAPGSTSHTKAIFKLEELLLDHVGEKNGGLEIVGKSNSGGKDITMDAVYELMDMKDGWIFNKSQTRIAFNIWYAQRFKPIFLTWVKNLRDLEPTMPLLEADEKLTGEKQSKLLQKAWSVSRSIYSIDTGPFEGERAVTDVGMIEDAYNFALKDAGKTPEQRSRDKWRDRAKNILSFMPGMGMVTAHYMNKNDEEKAKKVGAEESMKKIESASGTKMVGTTGAIKNTKGVEDLLTSPLARLGKVTPLAAIRYRAYGLRDLDLDRVRAVAALEGYVFKHVSMSDRGRAHFTLDAEQAYNMACGLFGLTALSTGDRNRWAFWFNRRFLPVCLAYVEAVKKLAPTADLFTPERTLKADKLLEVGQAMMNAKDHEDKSVWFITASPWNKDERLNSDSNAIAASLLVLKNTAEKKLMAEAKVPGSDAAVKQNKGALAGMMDTMRNGMSNISDWLLGDKNSRTVIGKGVDAIGAAHTAAWGAAKSAYSSVSGAVGSAMDSLGITANHPGNGTGGSINDLPNATSNNPSEIAKIIVAAAKMVGVDPGMALAIAHKESSLNPSAVNPASSRASGLFQMLTQGKYKIWQDQLRKHASKYGISPNASPLDPRANALMGIELIRENVESMRKVLGREPTYEDAYMAHFMGIGGYKRLVSKGMNVPSTQVATSQEVKQNPGIFVDKNGNVRTVGQVIQYHGEGIRKGLAAMGRQGLLAGLGIGTAAASTLPATTTTTANGAKGGVKAAEQAKSAAAVGAPDFSGLVPGAAKPAPKSEFKMAGMVTGATASAMPAAPSITSTASLNAAAATTSQSDVEAQRAAERERQMREQQTRAVEAQSVRQSQNDQAAMSRVGEILQKSLEAQHQIVKNTSDTVSVLRQLLRSSAENGKAESEATKATPEKPRSLPTTRPVQSKADRVPVSVRFNDAGS